MTVLTNKRGAWINQFAQPTAAVFNERVKSLDYVIIKYGLAFYEALARSAGIPWLAERMGEPVGPAAAEQYAQELADQANQPGCIGAVLNLEEADGGWHLDTDGIATRKLIDLFRAKAPGKALFASLDTRGTRPNYPYQRVCSQICDGVMPMVYPRAFGQSPRKAFDAALTPLLYERWKGKDIIPTFQTYGDISASDVAASAQICRDLSAAGKIAGANFYTLGHATADQWAKALDYMPVAPPPPVPPPAVDLATALVALARAWREGWIAIADRGTVQEAIAYAEYWRKLTSA